VGAGSREESASKQKCGPRPDAIGSEKALAEAQPQIFKKNAQYQSAGSALWQNPAGRLELPDLSSYLAGAPIDCGGPKNWRALFSRKGKTSRNILEFLLMACALE